MSRASGGSASEPARLRGDSGDTPICTLSLGLALARWSLFRPTTSGTISSILIPALLELEHVRVLVVDDASPDGTGAVADELAKASHGRVTVMHRTGERGLGRAYLDGLRHALRTDEAEVLCQMDADLSHRPVDLVRLLDAVSHADLVIGSRYVPGGQIENWPWRRRALSAIANRYVRRVCGLSPRDCTSGFRAWRRQTLHGLAARSHSLRRLCVPGRAPLGGEARGGTHRGITHHLRGAASRGLETPAAHPRGVGHAPLESSFP